jgi:hypothetical protein
MARFDTPTTKPFTEALAELLREHDFTTQTGNVNWHAFARELEGIHYETLRKVLAGQRTVTPHVMEEVSRALRIKPSYFVEWRAIEAARDFDVGSIGFDQVLANLDTWAKQQAAKNAGAKKAGRRRAS